MSPKENKKEKIDIPADDKKNHTFKLGKSLLLLCINYTSGLHCCLTAEIFALNLSFNSSVSLPMHAWVFFEYFSFLLPCIFRNAAMNKKKSVLCVLWWSGGMFRVYPTCFLCFFFLFQLFKIGSEFSIRTWMYWITYLFNMSGYMLMMLQLWHFGSQLIVV